MADEEKPQTKTAAKTGGSGKKKFLLFGGGGIGLLALAFVLAMVGVPGKQESKTFKGPFVAPLTAEKVQVNLTGSKSYLILDLNVVYDAYDESYFAERSADPLTIAEIRDALVALASSKSRDDVSDKVNKPIFMEEIRAAVEPLLFPVVLGDASQPHESDSKSGLTFGLSSSLATFRGPYEEHALHIDGGARTIQLDDGPVRKWTEEDGDLEVVAADGTTLYCDPTGVEPSFVGDVKVGVKGYPRRVLLKEILIQ